MHALGDLLRQAAQYQRLRDALRLGHARAVAQLLPDAVPFTLASLWQDLGASILVIAPRPEAARRLHEEIVAWTGQEDRVIHFPETETLPFERIVSDLDTVHRRLRALAALVEPGDRHPLVVASASAVAQKTVARAAFIASSHVLRAGQEVDLEGLLDAWRRMGYRFEPTVLEPGMVSRRGGILDIFPVGAPMPARIELWGSQIDGIRLFDPGSQRSTQSVDSIEVVPAQETLPALGDHDLVERAVAALDLSTCNPAAQARVREDLDRILEGRESDDLNFYSGLFNRGTLLDYFPEGGLVVVCRPAEVEAAAWEMDERTHDLRAVKEGRGDLPRGFPSSHLLWSEVETLAGAIERRLDVTPWGADDLGPRDVHALPFSSVPGYLGQVDRFAADALELAQEGHRVVAVTALPRRLEELLAERGVEGRVVESLDAAPGPGSITIVNSARGIRDGFVLSVEGRRLLVFSDVDIFGAAKQRRPRRRQRSAWSAAISELHPGAYVVHVEHGIGRLVGTGRAAAGGDGEGDAEYLIIDYAGGDRLYVPMEHMDRVSPYVAPMDHPPALTRLGTQEWRRARERVERSTREMASELLSLYANRELVRGHAFAPDGPWQRELEESFPYEETADQDAAIRQVKGDMEDTRPMDRLVCGDVGYGKTEIALRAAFKAVADGKQVAILVPTTVLAQQHYATFSQRLGAYPVAVEVLSRFRTDKEQRDVVEGLASGRVDICIGTHRLIQRDVIFKDLGLVVTDEEQRFGVAHKERLKQMRHEVDVLTLTATPIPRTLHLSLAGVRDMSTIETPPEERLPIKTYVSEFSDELIREAILRELDRDGQVFFLHNRVHSIDHMATYLGALVPEATVGIAHGQMPEGQLEQNMLDFSEHKSDVLLCTTIIESGLDIPNVNTLIISRADTLGLAQLYQLRGRVGRGARRAYTYLLIPPHRSLTEAAEKRLQTMLAATELGAGFHIAMKDLEIRGAGNILGSEQSGHIQAVGFDLYTRLLSGAVEELRAQRAAGLSPDGAAAPHAEGEPKAAPRPLTGPTADVAVDLGIPAHIPTEYVPDLPTRLGIYQRLAATEDLDGVAAMEDELADRFGPLPWQAQNLLYVLRLKLRARRGGVVSIVRDGDWVVLRLADDVGGAARALQRALGRGARIGHTQIHLDAADSAGWETPLLEAVERLADFRQRLTEAQAVG